MCASIRKLFYYYCNTVAWKHILRVEFVDFKKVYL